VAFLGSPFNVRWRFSAPAAAAPEPAAASAAACAAAAAAAPAASLLRPSPVGSLRVPPPLPLPLPSEQNTPKSSVNLSILLSFHGPYFFNSLSLFSFLSSSPFFFTFPISSLQTTQLVVYSVTFLHYSHPFYPSAIPDNSTLLPND
jgi:hypothetical protein